MTAHSNTAALPARYYHQPPTDTGTYVLPLKQSFIKDHRLMPGTRCMLALLTGWAGKGRALELTRATIGRHIGRSVRQVYRYVQDAARFGYLRYGYTKNRLGMVTGLRVWLRFDALRYQRAPNAPDKSVNRRIPARPYTTDINKNINISPENRQSLSKKLTLIRQELE